MADPGAKQLSLNAPREIIGVPPGRSSSTALGDVAATAASNTVSSQAVPDYPDPTTLDNDFGTVFKWDHQPKRRREDDDNNADEKVNDQERRLRRRAVEVQNKPFNEITYEANIAGFLDEALGDISLAQRRYYAKVEEHCTQRFYATAAPKIRWKYIPSELQCEAAHRYNLCLSFNTPKCL